MLCTWVGITDVAERNGAPFGRFFDFTAAFRELKKADVVDRGAIILRKIADVHLHDFCHNAI